MILKRMRNSSNFQVHSISNSCFLPLFQVVKRGSFFPSSNLQSCHLRSTPFPLLLGKNGHPVFSFLLLCHCLCLLLVSVSSLGIWAPMTPPLPSTRKGFGKFAFPSGINIFSRSSQNISSSPSLLFDRWQAFLLGLHKGNMRDDVTLFPR